MTINLLYDNQVYTIVNHTLLSLTKKGLKSILNLFFEMKILNTFVILRLLKIKKFK